jgi:hypothetical protein
VLKAISLSTLNKDPSVMRKTVAISDLHLVENETTSKLSNDANLDKGEHNEYFY